VRHKVVGGHVGQAPFADGHIFEARMLHQAVQLGGLWGKKDDKFYSTMLTASSCRNRNCIPAIGFGLIGLI